ncbi:hypothetical protein BDD12DRAFT_879479 [Trichophaea hybrida]|nr:hypothetical protein BDD12DRAFT_879479 [Trichophaea hybrida]
MSKGIVFGSEHAVEKPVKDCFCMVPRWENEGKIRVSQRAIQEFEQELADILKKLDGLYLDSQKKRKQFSVFLKGQAMGKEVGRLSRYRSLFEEAMSLTRKAQETMDQLRKEVQDIRSEHQTQAVILNNGVSEVQKKQKLYHETTALSIQGVERLLEESETRMLDFVTRFSYAKAKSNHHAACELKLGGAGNWLLQHHIFDEWKVRKAKWLWIYEIPGAGKFILMSSIIEHLAVSSNRI